MARRTETPSDRVQEHVQVPRAGVHHPRVFRANATVYQPVQVPSRSVRLGRIYRRAVTRARAAEMRYCPRPTWSRTKKSLETPFLYFAVLARRRKDQPHPA